MTSDLRLTGHHRDRGRVAHAGVARTRSRPRTASRHAHAQLRGARRRPRGRRRSTSRPRTRSTPRTRLLALDARQARARREAVHAQRGRGAARSSISRAAKELVVLEAMWTRWLPHMVRIRELLAAGALGEVRTAHRRPRPEAARPTRRTASRTPTSAAARCSTSASTRCRSPGTCSAQPSTRARDLVDRRRPASTGRPRSCSATPGGEQAVLHTALDARGPERPR